MLKAFINCRIWNSSASAFLIDDGYLIRTGTSDEVQEECSSQDEVIDLNGAFVIPGFTDCSLSLMNLGIEKSFLMLDQCRTVKQVQQKLAKELKKIDSSGWLIAFGLKCSDVVNKDLDEVSGDVPIAVVSFDRTFVLANAKAMKLAGISEDINGRIEGEDLDKVVSAWPKKSENEIMNLILKGAETASAQGIVMAGSDDFLTPFCDWKTVLDAMMRLAYQEKLPVRVNELCRFPSPQEFAGFLDEGYTAGVGDELFQTSYLKLNLDQNADSEETKACMNLASSYNMPVLSACADQSTLDEALRLYEPLKLEGNPLHQAVLPEKALTKHQADEITDQKLCCIAGQKEKKYLHALNQKTLLAFGNDGGSMLQRVQKAVKEGGMTVEEALECASVGGMHLFARDDLNGRIEESYHADFTVLDQNLLEIPADQIGNTNVMMTVVNGETVYEKQAFGSKE